MFLFNLCVSIRFERHTYGKTNVVEMTDERKVCMRLVVTSTTKLGFLSCLVWAGSKIRICFGIIFFCVCRLRDFESSLVI